MEDAFPGSGLLVPAAEAISKASQLAVASCYPARPSKPDPATQKSEKLAWFHDGWNGKTIIKPYKLKPAADSLSRDLSTRKQILLGHIRQNPKWHQLLPSNVTFKEWSCTDDETNGLEGTDTADSNVLRADIQDFLTCVATYLPAGFSETILRESTFLIQYPRM